jgi:hypothetical protein
MNKSRLTHLRTLCENATPGPWECRDSGWEHYLRVADTKDRTIVCPGDEMNAGFLRKEDMQFCIEARTALPEALAYIEDLELERKYLAPLLERSIRLEMQVDELNARVRELESNGR